MKPSQKLLNSGTGVSRLFEKVSQTKEIKYIQQASDILKTLSEKERKAMEILGPHYKIFTHLIKKRMPVVTYVFYILRNKDYFQPPPKAW